MPSWSTVIRDSRKLLADDIRNAWKWLSVQLGALIFMAPTIYENVDVVQDWLEPKTFHVIQAGLGILVMLNAVKKK